MCSEATNGSSLEEHVAIRVSNLSKVYAIYEQPQDRLKQSIFPRLQRLFGLPSKQYHRHHWVLSDLNFEVKKGETLGIIGVNGAGKSTLLQIITGTLFPTFGTVNINGRVAALLELGSGFNPEFTGRENVYMNAAILGLTTQEIDKKYDDILAFANIGNFIEQPVKTYSSGMLLRLAFSVIAHVDADVLIIDEALAVGDAFFAQKCMRFLRRFMKNGSVLFVSHDTGAVLNLCDKALILENGRIAATGAAKEVVEIYLASNQKDYALELEATDYPKSIHPQLYEEHKQFYDMRQSLINSSPLRNDIEIFRFNLDDSGFGVGGAKIQDVVLLNQSDHPLSWIVGGELVKLKITALALQSLESPIIGFHFKDRLGQIIFADNSYLTYRTMPLYVTPGQKLEAIFVFTMPILPVGEYSIDVALATGSQALHVQQHWIYDALLISSHTTSVCHGLIGLPMNRIEITIQ